LDEDILSCNFKTKDTTVSNYEPPPGMWAGKSKVLPGGLSRQSSPSTQRLTTD